MGPERDVLSSLLSLLRSLALPLQAHPGALRLLLHRPRSPLLLPTYHSPSSLTSNGGQEGSKLSQQILTRV